jgi:hypothetical protein
MMWIEALDRNPLKQVLPPTRQMKPPYLLAAEALAA